MAVLQQNNHKSKQAPEPNYFFRKSNVLTQTAYVPYLKQTFQTKLTNVFSSSSYNEFLRSSRYPQKTIFIKSPQISSFKPTVLKRQKHTRNPDNLKYNTLVPWANGTKESSTKRLMFQVFCFFMISCKILCKNPLNLFFYKITKMKIKRVFSALSL